MSKTISGLDTDSESFVLTNIGDLLTVSDNGELMRLPKGTNNDLLTTNTTENSDLKWSSTSTLGIVDTLTPNNYAGAFILSKTGNVLTQKELVPGNNGIGIFDDGVNIQIENVGVIACSNGGPGQSLVIDPSGIFYSLTAGTGINFLIEGGNNIRINSTASGDVTGPDSSTNNAICRFNGTTGKIIKNSIVEIDNLGNLFNIRSILLNPLGGNYYTITADNPSNLTDIHIIDPGTTNTQFVLTNGNQTISGDKTFSNSVKFTSGINHIILQPTGSGNTISLNVPVSPSSNRIYNIEDVGSNASFVMSSATNSGLNQIVTFADTSAKVIKRSTNAVYVTDLGGLTDVTSLFLKPIGSTFGYQINYPPPSVNRTYTLPDVGATADFLLTNGSQIITGSKTFEGSSSQIILRNIGNSGRALIQASTLSSDKTYIIPTLNIAGSAEFMLTEGGIQNINSQKNFATAPRLTASSNQLVFLPGGSGTSLTITCSNPAVNRTYTIIDSGGNSQFVMTNGVQTINDSKTFTQEIFADGGIKTTTVRNPNGSLNLEGVDMNLNQFLGGYNLTVNYGVATFNSDAINIRRNSSQCNYTIRTFNDLNTSGTGNFVLASFNTSYLGNSVYRFFWYVARVNAIHRTDSNSDMKYFEVLLTMKTNSTGQILSGFNTIQLTNQGTLNGVNLSWIQIDTINWKLEGSVTLAKDILWTGYIEERSKNYL